MPSASWPPNAEKPSAFDGGVIAFWLLVFAASCFLTSFMVAGSQTDARTFTLAAGRVSPPFTTAQADQILTVGVWQDVPERQWSYPEIEVLDEEGEYLFSFGEEFWHEVGVDDEGPWRESVQHTALDFVLPDPGTYRLRLALEGYDGPVKVTVARSGYSIMPHYLAGLVALGLGVVLARLVNGGIMPYASTGDGDDDDDE